MTMWTPTLEPGEAPRYIAIVEAIQRDIAAGTLRPGDRLPTHRELAQRLGVSVGTVTRAYAVAGQRRLTAGTVGRGTYVRDPTSSGDPWAEIRQHAGAIDLSMALPWQLPDDEESSLLAETLRAIADQPGLQELLLFHPDAALPRHCRGAAAWLSDLGVPATPDRVLITAGGQHALNVIIGALLRPGETVLTGELTYPGMKSLAQSSGIRLRGVSLDEEGICPDALERAARDGQARLLYCIPTVQNPTCGTMSPSRREAIVQVARRHDLLLIEDDVYRHLVPEHPASFAALAPDRTLHVTTFSKSLAFGLRTGFLLAPSGLVESLRAGVRSTIWMPAPLMTEVTMRWLQDGIAGAMVRRKRREVALRQQLVGEVLGPVMGVRHALHGLHAWLGLPEPWRTESFTAEARRRGVLVAGGDAFAVGRGVDVPHAVRICVGTPPDRDVLRSALLCLAALAQSESPPTTAIV